MEPDLSGDDLKMVRYRIIFTKRDEERILQESREELINYKTTASDFKAQKREGLVIVDIPDDDRKYITVMLELIGTLPKREAEYERRQAAALDRIANNF